ncbi:MAG: RluA family pseudouridine synthase [Acidimicrobiales bacterium]|nr:RluA family pseudouridine synthase [Acidimicrobiales bacterium]
MSEKPSQNPREGEGDGSSLTNSALRSHLGDEASRRLLPPGSSFPTASETGQRWPVPAALDGERVDRSVALITGLSRNEVEGLVAAGRVALAGRPVRQRSTKVRAGQEITVSGSLAPERAPALVGDAHVEVPVNYEDEWLIVVDKPAGLVVHPGAGHREGTLVHGLLARYPDLAALAAGEDAERPGVVHRLDKGTSGLLVVARTAAAQANLKAQLGERTMTREYTALVEGTLRSDRGLIDAPVGRSDTDPTRMRVHSGGRPARTRYEVVSRYSAPKPLTLIRCRLETGRTHQIRVHLASIGHPLVGDDRYGRGAGWKPLPPGRPFLHASALELDHPADGQRRYFSSLLPEDLSRVLGSLGS